MRLDPLYHWAPADRRRSIERLGLVPGRRSPKPVYDVDGEWRAPYVCLGPTPSLAAAYSWLSFGEPGQRWDLWQVRLEAADEVRANAQRGPDVTEVRVHNRIPKARLWWIGERVLRDVRGRPR